MMPVATATQGEHDGRCLGCRISRISSSEAWSNLEDAGAAGVKVLEANAIAGRNAGIPELVGRATALPAMSSRLSATAALPNDNVSF
jgi:hypothetical protein